MGQLRTDAAQRLFHSLISERVFMTRTTKALARTIGTKTRQRELFANRVHPIDSEHRPEPPSAKQT